MSQQDQLIVKNRELEAEIARYKETLAKMEKQWKQAVDAVNENKLQKQIEDLNAQLNAERKNVIQLKKDNTTLRLKAHMTEDDPQLESPGGIPDTSGVAMERIKELEKSIKLKDTEMQEKSIEFRTKISELELQVRTYDKNLETANQKMETMMEENKNLRKMANADEATKLREELRAAKERIPTLEADLKKVTDQSKLET